jgi:hypothetical protein
LAAVRGNAIKRLMIAASVAVLTLGLLWLLSVSVTLIGRL